MVKTIRTMDNASCVVTFFAADENGSNLPFMSKELSRNENGDFSFDADLGVEYDYRYTDSTKDTELNRIYVRCFYNKMAIVEIDGHKYREDDVCLVHIYDEDDNEIDTVCKPKRDGSICYNATDCEWILKERAEYLDLIEVDGKYYSEDDDDIVFIENEGVWYLRDECFECEHCGDWIHGSSTKVKTSSGSSEEWCEDCCKEDAFFCDRCEEYYSRENVDHATVEGGNTVCEYCLDDYCWCNECNTYVWWENYNEDANCCYECADRHSRHVCSYHSSHDRPTIYFKDGQEVEFDRTLKVFGFELEVDDGSSADDVIEEVESTDAYRLIRGFEHDGSLSSSGFETISYPMDIKTFQQTDWDEFLDCYQRYDFKSDQASYSCSLHVHFNRTGFFGNSVRSQENAVAKLYVFFRKYWDDLVKASRRRTNLSWCDLDHDIKYCDPELSVIQKQAEFVAKNKKNNNHGTAINQGNRDTIEIRLGRGTLNPKSFRSWVDFMYHIINNIKRIPFARAHEGGLWLKGISNETKDYLRKRGAFLNIIGAPQVEDVNIAVAEPDDTAE